MRRDQLEHIIRAAADITKETHFIVIGSQAILGQYPDAPGELLVSMEADLYPPANPELSDFIDGALGRDSLFGSRQRCNVTDACTTARADPASKHHHAPRPRPPPAVHRCPAPKQHPGSPAASPGASATEPLAPAPNIYALFA